MNDGLYHRDLGLPVGSTTVFEGQHRLAYGHHAVREACRDALGREALLASLERSSGENPLPVRLTLKTEHIVEVEVSGGRPVKAVLRVPYDDCIDLCAAVIPRDACLFVKTVWFNRTFDHHYTLDPAKYQRL